MPNSVPTPRVRWERQSNATMVASSVSSLGTTGVPTSTGSGGGSSSRGGNGFYNNQLFYILIAVLGAFAVISGINLLRTRRRRRLILREADRLGLMVPGMPGYVPMRERATFVKADGWRTPDWWEVEPDGNGPKEGVGAEGPEALENGGSLENGAGGGGLGDGDKNVEVEHVEFKGKEVNALPPLNEVDTEHSADDYGARGRLELPDVDELHPLALMPPALLVNEPVKPWSPIPYFPNYVSYLQSAHDPRPPRFQPNDPNAYDSLIGDDLQVVVALRMPTNQRPKEHPGEDDDDAVINEWSGLELGIVNMPVYKDT